MFELSSTRVSKLCFHLAIDVAVGEVRFMIGMLMRVIYIYTILGLLYRRFVICEFAIHRYILFVIYILVIKRGSYRYFGVPHIPVEVCLYLVAEHQNTMHKLHQCLFFFFLFPGCQYVSRSFHWGHKGLLRRHQDYRSQFNRGRGAYQFTVKT